MSLKQHVRTLVALAAFGLFVGIIGCGDSGTAPATGTTPPAGTGAPAGGAPTGGATPGGTTTP